MTNSLSGYHVCMALGCSATDHDKHVGVHFIVADKFLNMEFCILCLEIVSLYVCVTVVCVCFINIT